MKEKVAVAAWLGGDCAMTSLAGVPHWIAGKDCRLKKIEKII